MVTDGPVRRSRQPRAAPNGHRNGTRSVPYPARVIVVDEHDIPRAGLRGVLGGLPELEVVTEASDGRQAVALCRRLRPDLILMDLQIPGLDAISATRQIRQDSPDTR